jgi:hypothetical protein
VEAVCGSIWSCFQRFFGTCSDRESANQGEALLFETLLTGLVMFGLAADESTYPLLADQELVRLQLLSRVVPESGSQEKVRKGVVAPQARGRSAAAPGAATHPNELTTVHQTATNVSSQVAPTASTALIHRRLRGTSESTLVAINAAKIPQPMPNPRDSRKLISDKGQCNSEAYATGPAVAPAPTHNPLVTTITSRRIICPGRLYAAAD